MAEETTPATGENENRQDEAAADGATAEGTSSDTDTGTDALGDAGKRALHKERERARRAEAQVKELRAKAEAFDQAEDQKKSEQQRAADQLAKAEKERDDAIAATNRYRVALAKDLGEDLADVLGSGSAEEMESIADRLIKWRDEYAKAATATKKPEPNGVQGRGSAQSSNGTPADEFATFVNRQLNQR